MSVQKSFQNEDSKLYLVATPIGNLGDFSKRAIEILKEVDLVACEDTRVTIKLLNHFEIKKPLMSYHEHNKEVGGDKIVREIESGKSIALVSDAGMPCISDPGYEVVKSAISHGIDVVPIPGASAAVTSLIASGLVPQPYTFYGFLDHKKSKKRKQLEELKGHPFTLIFYESPYRFKDTMEVILDVLGDLNCAVVRELTKRYEEIFRGNVSEAISFYDTIKGEIALIIEGKKIEEQSPLLELDVVSHVDVYIKNGLKKNDAIKKVAKEREIPKRDVYNAYHQE
ncbi:16S rRNA (cytidine(1402)-2'-O)-methyltransferase [Haloplasma contractile]|uniref:Ribosomal RNA small subunit methyltransferase I n=1 Tax=Haloplasma contractile SSD-17B TaxID=1033810 RepID=U2FQV5_9MOLU|nr:16S rRNA (cytidine(1402)-2'-O)-methyltransferase [Haloplasma contractile]ERJ13394.1 Ribosomal RNA small subunit methyltransferase I protein [Haloplasma contractile SSD-17B]